MIRFKHLLVLSVFSLLPLAFPTTIFAEAFTLGQMDGNLEIDKSHNIQDMVVYKNGFAFVALKNGEIRLIENSLDPEKAGVISKEIKDKHPGIDIKAIGLAKFDNILYVIDDNNKGTIGVFDVTTPYKPARINTLTSVAGDSINAIASTENAPYLFVGTNEGIEVFKIDNPRSMVRFGSGFEQIGNEKILKLAISGSSLYVAMKNDVYIFDISAFSGESRKIAQFKFRMSDILKNDKALINNISAADGKLFVFGKRKGCGCNKCKGQINKVYSISGDHELNPMFIGAYEGIHDAPSAFKVVEFKEDAAYMLYELNDNKVGIFVRDNDRTDDVIEEEVVEVSDAVVKTLEPKIASEKTMNSNSELQIATQSVIEKPKVKQIQQVQLVQAAEKLEEKEGSADVEEGISGRENSLVEEPQAINQQNEINNAPVVDPKKKKELNKALDKLSDEIHAAYVSNQSVSAEEDQEDNYATLDKFFWSNANGELEKEAKSKKSPFEKLAIEAQEITTQEQYEKCSQCFEYYKNQFQNEIKQKLKLQKLKEEKE